MTCDLPACVILCVIYSMAHGFMFVQHLYFKIIIITAFFLISSSLFLQSVCDVTYRLMLGCMNDGECFNHTEMYVSEQAAKRRNFIDCLKGRRC